MPIAIHAHSIARRPACINESMHQAEPPSTLTPPAQQVGLHALSACCSRIGGARVVLLAFSLVLAAAHALDGCRPPTRLF